MNKPVIGFAGMTHLGLNSAVASAERGFRVICFDPDNDRADALQSGKSHVVEPQLPELLSKNRERLIFTTSVSELARCQVVYVAPDVPTDDKGQSDLTGIHSLFDKVNAAIHPDAIAVILSQVPPGFTRGLKRSPDRLFYQVETLIFGRAIERALYPERFIIGCADPTAPLPATLAYYLKTFDCPILPMRYESAELAKISINCCLVSSVSVANTLAELCESIGADWSEIVPALKLDKRIGQFAYLSPGLGLAGGNLERDLATILRFADRYGTDAGVVRAWVANSSHRRDWAAHVAREVILKNKPEAVIAVWGLAYKENTHSIKNSPSLATITQLREARLRVHDPVVPTSVVGHKHVEGASNPLVAAEGADALMVLTPWPQYREIPVADIACVMRGRTLIDPYRVFDGRMAVRSGLDYYTLGVPPLLVKREMAHA